MSLKEEIFFNISEIMKNHKKPQTRKNKIFNYLSKNSVVFSYFRFKDKKNVGFVISRVEREFFNFYISYFKDDHRYISNVNYKTEKEIKNYFGVGKSSIKYTKDKHYLINKLYSINILLEE